MEIWCLFKSSSFGQDTKTSEVVVIKYIHKLVKESQWNVNKVGGDSPSRTHAVQGI